MSQSMSDSQSPLIGEFIDEAVDDQSAMMMGSRN
jgi:hypothetical protein